MSEGTENGCRNGDIVRPAYLILPLALLAAFQQNPLGTTTLGVKGSPAWFTTAPLEAIATHYQTSCQSYGYQPGTADMARRVERSAEEARGPMLFVEIERQNTILPASLGREP